MTQQVASQCRAAVGSALHTSASLLGFASRDSTEKQVAGLKWMICEVPPYKPQEPWKALPSVHPPHPISALAAHILGQCIAAEKGDATREPANRGLARGAHSPVHGFPEGLLEPDCHVFRIGRPSWSSGYQESEPLWAAKHLTGKNSASESGTSASILEKAVRSHRDCRSLAASHQDEQEDPY